MKPKISIIMPVRNEGVNLRIILKVINAIIEEPYEVLVVYDSPDDDSIPIANEMAKKYHARPVHNPIGRGVINAVRTGVAKARSDCIVILTADDIGPVFSVDRMYAKIQEGYDMVNATRYSKGGRSMGGAGSARILSKTANMLFRLSGTKLTDHTMGVKMFRREMLERLNLAAKPVGWAFAFELSVKSQLAGFRITELPIVSINRFYGGKSSFRLKSWIFEYIKWFIWGFWKLRTSK